MTLKGNFSICNFCLNFGKPHFVVVIIDHTFDTSAKETSRETFKTAFNGSGSVITNHELYYVDHRVA